MTFSERTYQISIGVLVLVILVGGWWAFDKKGLPIKGDATTLSEAVSQNSDAAADATSGTRPVTPAASVAVSGDAVSVQDQSAGDTVRVDSATLPHMGWVAVRDGDGRVLGAARLEAGAHTTVQVELLRATETGERYQILLYVDDGDKAFDLHKDTLLMNADGSVSGAAFTAR